MFCKLVVSTCPCFLSCHSVLLPLSFLLLFLQSPQFVVLLPFHRRTLESLLSPHSVFFPLPSLFCLLSTLLFRLLNCNQISLLELCLKCLGLGGNNSRSCK